MEELKERLYETIDVAYESEEEMKGICERDQIRLARVSDGSIRLYYDDCMGPGRIDLTPENARTLLYQLLEALKEEKPAAVPLQTPFPYIPQVPNLGSDNTYRRCPTCGK